MIELELLRDKSTKGGTLGTLYLNGKQLCYTLEEPWNDNKNHISCIPEGTYKCTPHNTINHRNVWVLNNVPKRSGILIHSGNTINDISGCILVGERIGTLNGLPAVLNSRLALNKLRGILPKEFIIRIVDYKEKITTKEEPNVIEETKVITPKLNWFQRLLLKLKGN